MCQVLTVPKAEEIEVLSPSSPLFLVAKKVGTKPQKYTLITSLDRSLI